MLENTFLHLRGIGPNGERALWRRGILTWSDFQREQNPTLSLFKDTDILPRGEFWQEIAASKHALAQKDASYFHDRLPKSEQFRIAMSFPADTVFLDIETTGLSHYYDHVTIIGISILDKYLFWVKGQDLDRVSSVLSNAKCLVTFNGTLFDIPFLRRLMPNIELPKVHVDLRFLCRRVGLIGGQKSIERELGLSRQLEVAAVTGEIAPLLWHDYKNGSMDALRRLVAYNHSDIEGMKAILDEAIKRWQISKEHDFLRRQSNFVTYKSTINWNKMSKKSKSTQEFSGSLHPYVPPQGPTVCYTDLASRKQRLPRIIGIDLTGSEQRPSGFAILDGPVATTKRVLTDNELIDLALSIRPDLVSIDSPLSLPAGRCKVTDDDPGRHEFGIMRECERTLKRRGVNVYPALINSMQRLTQRGIDLARRLRQLGLPVIESYPGAAQDILGIPRKRQSIEYLAKGLQNFGITGEYTEKPVSHDELDAITSAIVGLFFLDGRFEALGNSREDYLIVPDLKTSNLRWHNRCVIGLSGQIAAGKTTIGNYLREKGFAYGRFSQVLADELLQAGVSATRKALQDYGESTNRGLRQRALCQKLVSLFSNEKTIVIDGLRFLEDYAFMLEQFGPAFVHIHVSSEEQVRRERYAMAYDTSCEFEVAISAAVEAEVSALENVAHIRLQNNRGKDELFSEIDLVLTNILNKEVA